MTNEIFSINRDRIVLNHACDATKLRGHVCLAIRGPHGAIRGSVMVRAVLEEEGVVITDGSVTSFVPTACAGDTIEIVPVCSSRPEGESQVRRVCNSITIIERQLERMHPEDRAVALEVLVERWDAKTGERRS